MNKDILLCGVGGQGIVLASRIIAGAAMKAEEKVSSAETIGMAQKGGCVTSHVRIGDSHSPLIPLSRADIMMAFEPAEAVRNIDYLKPEGVVIVNRTPVMPVSASLSGSRYNANEMIDFLEENFQCVVVDSSVFKSEKFLNIGMLGVAVATGKLGFSKELIIKEIKTRVPNRFMEVNLEAFEMGFCLGGKS